ncbi:hypothetical protein FQN54_005251 [Arachnomyces sp. PD_36]|nr:hypothetical protein FQN54_005251 [Arachnomyces sp. PD_36]
MSYADIAAKNAHQTAEESSRHQRDIAHKHLSNAMLTPYSAAPSMPEVESTETDTSQLIDVDSPHVSSVPADFEDQSVKTTTQAERIERDSKARAKAEKAKQDAVREAERAENKARRAGSALSRNRDNPVVVGNVLLFVLTAAGLGFGAYKKQAEGTLTWKVASLWSGAVGAVAFGDYFVSKWLFQNKYPNK